MRQRVARRIGSLVSAFAMAALGSTHSAAQTCTAVCNPAWGTPVGCGAFAKPWVRRSTARVEVVGSLHHLRRWHDAYDNDWNFILKPDPAFTDRAKQRDGTVNPQEGSAINESGLIEGEVHSIFEVIDSAFSDRHTLAPSGMRVRAKGWWVEDIYHDAKTELHPMTAILGQGAPGTPGEGNDLSVLISHDWSDRFCVEDQTLNEFVSIPLNTRADAVPVGTYTGATSAVEALVESAMLDGDIGAQRSEMRTTQTVRPDGTGTLTLNPTLFKPHPDAPANYRPLYLGRLKREGNAVFADQVETHLVTRAPGCQGLEVSISAQLSNPPARPAASHWDWVLDDDAPDHNAGFSKTVYYSPCNNEYRSAWQLRATAASGAPDFQPPRGGPNEPGRVGFLNRTPTRAFTQKVRTYELKASAIDLSAATTGPASTTPPTPPGGTVLVSPMATVCGGSTTVSATATLASQLLSEAGFRWTIREGASSYALDASSPSASGSHFTASVSAADRHVLTITWNHAATVIGASSGAPTPAPTASSGGPVTVRAEFTTEVGESPTKTVAVNRICWVAGGGKTFSDFMKNLPRLEAALRKLGGADFPDYGAALPTVIHKLDRADLMKAPRESGDPVPSKRNQELLRLIAKARDGQSLTQPEATTLAAALAVASSITADQADINSALRSRGIVPH